MRNGFTLIELMVVIAIVAILLGMGIASYNNWKKKYDIENDTKRIFSALTEARIKTFSEKRVYGITWSENPFKRFELRYDTDNDGDITDNPGSEKISEITLKGSSFIGSIGGFKKYVKFSKEGIAKNLGNIRASNLDIIPEYNCVNISRTRIKMGQWNGSDCEVR